MANRPAGPAEPHSSQTNFSDRPHLLHRKVMKSGLASLTSCPAIIMSVPQSRHAGSSPVSKGWSRNSWSLDIASSHRGLTSNASVNCCRAIRSSRRGDKKPAGLNLPSLLDPLAGFLRLLLHIVLVPRENGSFWSTQ